MKAHVRCGAFAWLLLVACNRPDTDLFGGDGPAANANGVGGGGGQAAAGLTSAGNTASSGGTSANGAPAVAGNAPTAGSPADSNAAGSPNPPDDPGAAGAPDAAGGMGEPQKPVEPLCGNGILEAGEECDDAGHSGQDGCLATCKVACANFGPDTAESEDYHCYNGYDAANFEGAQAACVKLGAHLATISSAAENKIVRSFVNNSKWLGGYEDVSATSPGTGSYVWLSGEAFSYTNWAAREPDQAKVRCSAWSQSCYEHCISMLGDGTWADAACDVSDGYVCEWEPAGTK